MNHRVRKGRAWAIALVAILLTGLVAPVASGAPPGEIQQTQGFRKGVTVAGIREHQAAFQSFADALGGNRVASSAAYDASADYVAERMEAAGYVVSFHTFSFLFNADLTPPVFTQVSPASVDYVDGVDFLSMTFSPNGDFTAAVAAVDLNTANPAGAVTSGCEAGDFAGFPAGNIALIQRGTCTFAQKAANAAAAGASAVIVFNRGVPGQEAAFGGTLGGPVAHNAPVIGTSFAIGVDLANGVTNGATGSTARVRVDRINEERETRNVIAETPDGDPNRVVVIGAHLDSVPRGPGINDNGSGSGTILEIAEVFAAQDRVPRNKLRFMWYSAEEFGLLGSEAYVDSLTAAQRDQIELMLNFDMVGSPNMVRFVYDGDNSTFPPVPMQVQAGPPGSGEIERVFVDYFDAQGLMSEPTPFSGRSDYGPFILATPGIPAGGLFTGAEGVKTAAQAVTYGGVAGEQYDPCYHLACDTFAGSGGETVGGVGLIGLDQMSDAAAHAVLLFSKRNFAKEPLTTESVAANPALTQRSVGGATDAPSFAVEDRVAE